ncbi:TatD family hydrolase [Thermosulfurimonas dismutans]|uniref:Putative deoxyribonuclease YcfH n=1 Tax=Thermosulfurimonas dismutans TaxID=999894 RepID=A0A179D5V2_9BACT|nr:TatD family hydrolase [Thermosulfurimonas dismutans]OAQ21475.1 putative deoxyribonuclease YcfH [Thermosulfurimonas dismutans]
MKLVDTHAHLNLPGYDDLEEVILRAKEAGVTRIVVVGIDLKTSREALELSERFPGYIFATAGIHPHEVKKLEDRDYEELKNLLKKAVALGEIGLDFAKEYSPRKQQFEHLERQLAIAKELDLPVVLHVREAYREIFPVLKKYLPLKAVFHCFAGGIEEARQALDLGLYISVTGIVTFPKGDNIREVVRYAPLESLMLETDCPFLTPVPYRGKRNEPAYVQLVAEKVAEVKGLEVEECARVTTETARAFFGI